MDLEDKQRGLKKLEEIKEKLAKQIILEDDFKEINTICGFDLAYTDHKAVGAAVLLEFPSLKIIEIKSCVMDIPLNYIPGFLAFREGPIMIEVYNKLKQKPDVLMVGGHGISAPSMMGLATYMGVVLNKVSIGIAKKLLVGEIHKEKVYIKGDVRAIKIETKEGANPIFVSQGNRISLEKAVEITKQCILEKHKLPEPIRLAHKHANKVKDSLNLGYNPE